MINQRAELGRELASLAERIPALEKLSRKTPPKTLVKEWENIRQAKSLLVQLKRDQEKLKQKLAWFAVQEERELIRNWEARGNKGWDLETAIRDRHLALKDFCLSKFLAEEQKTINCLSL